MRVLHVPFCYYPDPVGGTERYVELLAKRQRQKGWEAAVAAPGDGPASYEYNGIPVRTFGVSPVRDIRELYGEGDRHSAEAFGKILDEDRPDIVHLHAMTRAVSIQLVRQVKSRGIPVVFNYHTPTTSCIRGSLLRWGSTICDGALDRRACASCTLHGLGLPRMVSRLVASIPARAGKRLNYAVPKCGMRTIFRMSELVALRIRAFHDFMNAVDHVIALCTWTRELLMRNGVPSTKVTLCPHGIGDYPADSSEVDRTEIMPIRTAFLGRFDPTKGLHVVVQALIDNPDLPVRLDIYGVSQGQAGKRYLGRLQSLIQGDLRIRILPPLHADDVVARLRAYHILVVPSQWLETGPLVVLESFAAQTPVLGSNLGGIAELVTNEVDGLLVEPVDSPKAWAESLGKLVSHPGLLTTLRKGVRPPRHMEQAADETLSVYRVLLCKTTAA